MIASRMIGSVMRLRSAQMDSAAAGASNGVTKYTPANASDEPTEASAPREPWEIERGTP